MREQAYEVILWDWNGTLLDDGRFGREIIDRMLRKRGLRVPGQEEHRELFDFPVIRYYERLGFDFAAEPFEVISQEFVDAYIGGVRNCKLRTDARETLGRLREAGFRQNILSASRQDYLDELVQHFGLKAYFGELLGIDSVHAPGKAERGRDWINASGLDPARVVLIGDTMHDAEVAESMGIDCWLLEGGHHSSGKLARTGCRRLADLPAVVTALTTNRTRVSA